MGRAQAPGTPRAKARVDERGGSAERKRKPAAVVESMSDGDENNVGKEEVKHRLEELEDLFL